MLVVTTTVRVIDGVHSNTTSSGPAGTTLGLDFVVGVTGLEQGLVDTTTTGDNTNNTTSVGAEDLLGTRGELDTGLALVGVTNDNNVGARGAAKSTTVTDLLLDVAHDGTLGDGAKREDVADCESSVLTSVHELTSVETLVGNEGLSAVAVVVGVTEDDLGKGSTTAGVVNDLLDETASVTVTLSVVESAELSSTLAETRGSGENRASTFTLVADNSSHFSGLTRFDNCGLWILSVSLNFSALSPTWDPIYY